MATENAVQIDQAQTSGAKIATLQITRGGQAVEIQEVAITNPETGDSLLPDASGAMPVSGPLTDTQLRATAVPVSGPLTDTQLRATAVPVSGPLTDTQLRATAVPVSGPLTDAELRATAVPVSGPLTDTQLRATAVPVSESAPSATGTLAALNDAVELSVSGYSCAAIDVRGNLSGTMTPEGTVDGATWFTLNVFSAQAAAGAFATTTSNGTSYIANTAGLSKIRVRASSYVSGSSAVALRGSPGVSTVQALLPPTTTLLGDVSLGVRTTTTNATLRQKIISTASTNATAVKSSAGRVYGYVLANTSAAWCYLKLFNKTAAPNLGVDTPTAVIGIPPGQSIEFANPIGSAHSLGIAMAITAAPTDLDATAISANDIVGTIIYA